MRAAFLPDGDIVVQVVKRRIIFSDRAQSSVLRTTSFLEVFDPSWNRKATGIPVQGFGQMQGITQDGGIYFNNIYAQKGIHIVKGRLTSN